MEHFGLLHAIPAGMVPQADPNGPGETMNKDLIARRDAALGSAYRLFYASPVEFARGEGVYLYDPDGNAYLDAYNNVPSVGHSHPHVTEAVTRQLATLNTHTRYLTDRPRRLRRAAAGHPPGRGRARDVHLHRQRGERPRAPDRPAPHRRQRGHRRPPTPTTA